MKTEIVHHQSGGVTFAGKDAVRVALLMRALGETERMARHDMIPERREECRRDAMIYACLAEAITNKLRHDQGEYVTTFAAHPVPLT